MGLNQELPLVIMSTNKQTSQQAVGSKKTEGNNWY